MTIEERVEQIIRMINDMCSEKDIRAAIQIALADAYAQGCEDTETELES